MFFFTWLRWNKRIAVTRPRWALSLYLACIKSLLYPLKIGFSTFVVGEEGKYACISELEHKHFGSLWIYGLLYWNNQKEAAQANLKQKQDLEHLGFRWGWSFPRAFMNTPERGWDVAVLEALKPPSSIKSLNLCGDPGAEYSNWMMLEEMNTSSFPYLTSLTLSSLQNCPSLTRLVEQPAQNGTAGDTNLESYSDSCHFKLQYCAAGSPGNNLFRF